MSEPRQNAWATASELITERKLDLARCSESEGSADGRRDHAESRRSRGRERLVRLHRWQRLRQRRGRRAEVYVIQDVEEVGAELQRLLPR